MINIKEIILFIFYASIYLDTLYNMEILGLEPRTQICKICVLPTKL
jgi:hypothetical protein